MRAAFGRLTLLNVRQLRTHWGRAAASVAVIAVSGGLLVAVLGMSGSITGSIDRLATSIGGDADLEVSGVTDAGFDESLLGAVAGLPSVDAAVPLLRMQTTANSSRALLIGADEHISALHSDLQRAIHDQLQAGPPPPSAPNGVIVGPGVGVHTGDQFEVEATRVTAAAVVDGPAARRLNGGHFVLASLPLAQRIAGRDGMLDSILVFNAPGASIDQLRSAVTAAVAGRAVVATPSFRAAQASSSFTILQAMTLLAASVSLVVAGFLTYNAMSIAIAQRRPTIATVRALGGRRRAIVSDLLGEAALLGLVGGVIGSACGILVARIAIAQLPSTLVQSLDAHIEFVLPVYVVPVALTACVVASVFATALATRRVHSVAPVEALAPIPVSSAETSSRRLRIAAGIAGVILAAATVVAVSGDFGRIGLVSIALAFIAGNTICLAFAAQLIRAAATVARLFGAPGMLAATSIERAPGRMWVAMMTVLTAVATTVAVTGATSNAVDSTVVSFSSVADADLWVSSTPATDYPTAPLLPADAEAKVSGLPGVKSVVPGQMAFVTVGDTRIMMVGIAPGSHRDIFKSMSERDRDKLLTGDGVTLSRDLGHAMGVSPGDDITLQTPAGERRVRVLELVPYFSGLTGTIAISLETMQEWFRREGATDLEVTVTPGVDPRAVQAEVRNALPASVFVYSGHDALAGVSSALDQVIAVVKIIAWIVVAVAAVSLLNTLMLSVMDRRREIGVLHAIGATRIFALKVIVAEAAGVGMVGGSIGLLLGSAIQYLISIALTDMLSIDVGYNASPATIAIGFGALVVCLLGSLPPAARAARLNIVQAVGVD